MTLQLICWGTYTQIHPKIYLPVYLHAFLSSNHKKLPITTTTCVYAHWCVRSWPYAFIFILSFRLTAEIYPSTFLLLYMYTDAHVHQYTSTVYFFIFGTACTVTFPLICWGMYSQIHMLLLCLRTKTYLSPQLLVYLPFSVPDHDPACSFSYFKYSIWLTAKIYSSTFLLLYMSIDISVHQYTCSIFLPFRHNMHSYLSAHLLGYVHKIYPEVNLPVYFHTSPLSNNKDLPVTTTTCVPAHRCTLFIVIL